MTTAHVTNGGCAAEKLRAFLDDPVIVTTDVLHDGPAPDVPLEQWYDIRARELSSDGSFRFDTVRQDLAETDRAIATAARHGRVILWFEHDLYDQLLLIRTLDLLSRTPAADVSLICIDRFPGVARFVGLGQLTPDQLATLAGTHVPVTPEQYGVASRAWDAFRAADPDALVEFVSVKRDADPLPFLRPALKRLLEEYPWTTNGLSRTEHAILRALEQGPLAGVDLFPATQATEEAPFLGDLGLFDAVRGLGHGRVPLVTITPEDDAVDLRPHRIAITDAGRAVLAGGRDAIALNGIDTWRGGVRLDGTRRWDPASGTLVSCS